MSDHRPLVRVVTAGSVDDGKSTLIGRLLLDTDSLLIDQVESVERASRQTGELETNLALLTDGLRDEREQKITIDVSYRPFSTLQRRFLLADAPGHAQYTRNMFTAASTAEVAILLVDAERGPTPQTWRHAFVLSLLRVPHVLIAVNKMDRVGYQEAFYRQRLEELRAHLSRLEFADLRFVPLSAKEGEGVAGFSGRMPWFDGPSVLGFLDTVEIATRSTPVEFRFPIQGVVRPHDAYRAAMGEAVSGSIRVGERVRVLPSGVETEIRTIRGVSQGLGEASVGVPVLIEVTHEVDLGRGQLLVRPRNPATVAHRAEATVAWMSDRVGVDSSFWLRQTTNEVPARISELVYRLNIETLHREASDTLAINEFGRVVLELGTPIAADLFEHHRATGGFILVDRSTHEIAAAGVFTRLMASDPGALGRVLWMTGLSGAGKSTLAGATVERLRRQGVPVFMLDGDALRRGVNRDLGFSESDRDENLRRAAEMAKLLVDQGITVIASFITPLNSQRARIREVLGDRYVEVYVACSLETAERRDPKGLYRRARSGELRDFTGIGSPFEVPTAPDLILDTEKESLDVLAENLMKFLQSPQKL